jgi:hypothetical protein
MTSIALERTGSVARAGTAVLVAVALGIAIAGATEVRVVVASVALFILLPLAIAAPTNALVLTLSALPFLALIRRMLLDFEPWRTADPLLLVAPVAVVVLLIKLFVIERRELGGDRLSTLALAVLVVTVLQSVNPRGGSLTAGLTALLFAAVPLLWFFVGRELVDDAALERALKLVIPIGLVAASYGLIQTHIGLPHWDASWVSSSGYGALQVGNRIRAFGTFSSAAEYATYLSVVIVVCSTFAYRLRLLPLAIVPLIAVALFLDSSRAIVVVTFAALVIVAGARTGRVTGMIALTGIAVLGAVLAVKATGSHLQARAAATNNPLVTHQVDGLVNPFDPQQSTLLLHVQGLEKGVTSGFHSVLGQGIAATTLAGSKLGGNAQTTELDISDAFVGLGLGGGLLYLAFVLAALWSAARVALRRRDALSLAVLGILVLTLGQWLNGGYYAVSALVWVMLGWLASTGHREAAV